jgi:hypothetical protein
MNSINMSIIVTTIIKYDITIVTNYSVRIPRPLVSVSTASISVY